MEPLSALVHVDQNMGTVVRDAFVVPEPLQDLAINIGTLIDDPDQSLTRTDPVTARAVNEAAIDYGLTVHPPARPAIEHGRGRRG